MRWKTLARNSKYVKGAIITETISGDDQRRRFTATIRGWRNWRIWEGPTAQASATLPSVIEKVRQIRDRIDAGDETVFNEPSIVQIEGNPA